MLNARQLGHLILMGADDNVCVVEEEEEEEEDVEAVVEGCAVLTMGLRFQPVNRAGSAGTSDA